MGEVIKLFVHKEEHLKLGAVLNKKTVKINLDKYDVIRFCSISEHARVSEHASSCRL